MGVHIHWVCMHGVLIHVHGSCTRPLDVFSRRIILWSEKEDIHAHPDTDARLCLYMGDRESRHSHFGWKQLGMHGCAYTHEHPCFPQIVPIKYKYQPPLLHLVHHGEPHLSPSVEIKPPLGVESFSPKSLLDNIASLT